MSKIYANEFREIHSVLQRRPDLRSAMLMLVDSQPMHGKVIEGENRINSFRQILRQLILGNLSLEEAYQKTEHALPRQTSTYSNNNRVFADGWAERLVRTQY